MVSWISYRNLLACVAFPAGGVGDLRFAVALNHHFTLIRELVVQSQNMACLTVRFHVNSSILLIVLRTSLLSQTKCNPLGCRSSIAGFYKGAFCPLTT